MDRSVLDEVVASIEPADEVSAARVRSRLGSLGLGALAALAAEMAGMRRRAGAPTERKVMIAVAADHGPSDPGLGFALDDLVAGRGPLASLCRAAQARMVLVDAGLRGAAEEREGVISLRAGDGLEGEMSQLQALVCVQSGIALALSLASEGVDVLVLADLAGGDAHGLLGALAGAPPLAALALAGGFQHGVLAGIALAAAAMRLPVLLDGASASAAGRLAGAFAPAALAYQLVPPNVGVSRDDGSGAVAALPLLDAAARLARELT